MPTDDRWPPTPPHGEGRASAGASDPRWSGHPHYEGYNRQSPPVAGRPTPPTRDPANGYAPPAPARPGPEPDLFAPRRGPVRGHGRRKRRFPILALVILLLGIAAVGAGLRFAPGSPFAPVKGGDAAGDEPTPTPTPTPAPLPFRVDTVTLPTLGTGGFVSWAIMDRRSGEIWGSDNMTTTSWTASMIKGWLAADYLRRAADASRTPTTSQLHTVEIMIRDSDNNAATTSTTPTARAPRSSG